MLELVIPATIALFFVFLGSMTIYKYCSLVRFTNVFPFIRVRPNNSNEDIISFGIYCFGLLIPAIAILFDNMPSQITGLVGIVFILAFMGNTVYHLLTLLRAPTGFKLLVLMIESYFCSFIIFFAGISIVLGQIRFR